MAAIIKIRYAMFGIGVFGALPGGAHAASYAEILFKEKFDVHIREMVADGIMKAEF